jgi:ABC-type Fe3+-hydroxamate transport system substrate-binding protein
MVGSYKDYLGTSHVPTTNARIISLVPSLTELLFDLGLRDQLVGRTHFCIHPKDQIDAIPSVGGTKKVNMERVLALKPTHALVNIDENPRDMADAFRDAGIEVVVTHPMTPDDNIGLYQLIGGIFGASDLANNLVQQFETVKTRLQNLNLSEPKNVLYLIWNEPWMAITKNTYIGNMLSLINWHAVTPGANSSLSGDAARYPEIMLNDAGLCRIDLVLFSSEPYTFTQTHIDDFRREFPDHAAKTHLIDGEMTSWYGSRAIKSLGELGEFAKSISS